MALTTTERSCQSTRSLTTLAPAPSALEYPEGQPPTRSTPSTGPVPQVKLDGPTVASMFVDVPFTCRDDAGPAEFLREVAAAHPGDAAVSEGFVVTGATQPLLHPGWSGNALVVAGPGQGKSNLLQFPCQFHRGRRTRRR
jgi:hypothetical protein